MYSETQTAPPDEHAVRAEALSTPAVTSPRTRTGRFRPAIRLTRRDLPVAVLLLLTMLLAGYFRFVGLSWDDFVKWHPDERFLTDVASRIGSGSLQFTGEDTDAQWATCLERYPDTNGVGGYFDARCSDLNPHNVDKGLYVYGTMPLFAARTLGQMVDQITGTDRWTNYGSVNLVWRTMNAVCDMLVVLIVFLTGLKLHGRWVGLLAAFLYACAVFPIQIAHFGTADAMTSLWVAATIYFAVRIQQNGGWLDYALVGVAFGSALASRFNIAPLVLSIILVAGLRMLPYFDRYLPSNERNRALTLHFGGLVLAGFMTLLVFRIFNPYAFVGPGFFGLLPNERWLADLGQARYLTSPEWEGPPAWQWVGRPAYIYPFNNMVLWGMGIALGITGWLGWGWSLWQLLRGRADGLKHAPLVIWILVFFGWIGTNHVTSMRYFLPLYPMFAVLAAWLLVEWVRRAGNVQLPARRQVLRLAAAGTLAVVALFTLLWAAMFTNIYRHMATFTQSSHWVWENVPGDFAMQLDGTEPGLDADSVPLINIPLGNSGGQHNDMLSKATRLFPNQPVTYTFTAPADGTVSSIHAPRIGVPTPDITGSSALRIRISDTETGSVLQETILTDEFPYLGDQIGEPFDIPLSEPLQVEFGKEYEFLVEVILGGPVVTGGSIFARDGGWEEVAPPDICLLPVGITLADNPPSGLSDSSNCDRRAPLGSLVVSYDFNLEYEDHAEKRADVQRILDGTDYIIIATNRRYDSQARIPLRWPLTNRYYDALFSGELGFELVETFQETFELGPLQVSDQYLPTYDSPEWLNELEAEEAFHVYDHPVVYIFKKTEAYSSSVTRQILYSVPLDTAPGQYATGNAYDDPALINIVPWRVSQAEQSPTQLMLTDDMRETQYSGGTWSERFDRDSFVNQNEVVSVVVWWLTMLAFGWVMYPLMFVAVPGLADRGYALAKFAGILFVAWSGWALAAARVPVWSPEGLRLLFGLLTVVSAVVAWRVRVQLIAFIRTHWRLLLITEGITLLLFLAFIGVRLTNPDLWTSSFGGEKPMDVAYFNAVLRSTIFPPLDPWFAGGYINYYYFGFVIVGVPTLFTGIVPAVAYNLILPMLFALTGIGAFSVAFTLVQRLQERPDGTNGGASAVAHGINGNGSGRRRLGNPYIAGVLALLMAVVLGNLDTPRTIATGLARTGGYVDGVDRTTVDDYILQYGSEPDKDQQLRLRYLLERYRTSTGVEPDATARSEIYQQSRDDFSTGQSIQFELWLAADIAGSVLEGLGKVVSGQSNFYVSPDRWFWGPSRVISESVGGGAITEMPAFTYIYGDLHGHMIAQPLMLLIVGLVLNELLLAGREQRYTLSRAAALFLIALAVGLTIATNSWEYPTFTLFGALGLGYAWWLNWRRINRASLVSMVIRLSAFFILSYAVALPYRTWFASEYASFRLWDGTQTPLWAYLTIHGLFLFFIALLLLWETGRWLRAVRVRALRGRQLWIGGFLVAAVGVVLVALLAAFSNYQAALIVLPLVVWIGVLFFRPGQSIPMQFVLVLAGLALAITLGVEVVVLDGDIGRQNTVFKFYMQVWLLLSVASGAAAAWLIESSNRWRLPLQIAFYIPAAALLFVAALFPALAVPGKATYRLPPDDVLAALPPSLDGDEFMRLTPDYNFDIFPQPVDLGIDYNIITWLQDNVQGSPVIMEGISERVLYQWGGRIAIQTGLPSVVGWDWHQKQQRTFDPLPSLIEHRRANVNNFYLTADLEQAWRILRAYDVSYVIVGALEQGRYTADGLAKLDAMVEAGWLDVVYETPSRPLEQKNPDGTVISSIERPSGKIYQVNKNAAPEIYIDGGIEGGGVSQSPAPTRMDGSDETVVSLP